MQMAANSGLSELLAGLGTLATTSWTSGREEVVVLMLASTLRTQIIEEYQSVSLNRVSSVSTSNGAIK